MRPLVKLCGLRSAEDAAAAVAAGADMVGVVLVPGARRAVTPERAREIARSAREAAARHGRPAPETIAVVGRMTPEQAQRAVEQAGVDCVQLVGSETDALGIAAAVTPRRVIRAIAVGATSDAVQLMRVSEEWEARGARVLYDALVDGELGGTGASAPADLVGPLLARGGRGLAGGLRPDNVAAAARAHRPSFVDVSSGIEGEAGHKDADLMAGFVEAARSADGDALDGFRLDARAMGESPGRFGAYGGSWVPEVLVPAAQRIAAAWEQARRDVDFTAQYARLCREFVGRPTPLQPAPRLTAHGNGARILLKREDLAHTGAHKINNALGQALLARSLGARRVIAETGAGQHGVAAATACALLGIDCIVYMGSHDIERQHPNVVRMELLGAEVRPVDEGTRTLTDAVSAAIRDWVSDPEQTYYLIGSAVGMHPFPTIVRDLQSVIGHETRVQSLRLLGRLPDAVVACVGGGSNAIGSFMPFVDDEAVELHGAEAAGDGLDSGRHAASIVAGSDGVLHGARTRVLQDGDGQIVPTHSISAGLDYPGVGPEHAHLASSGRAAYHAVTDDEAMQALELLCRTEGIIPAIESAHAIALALRLASGRPPEEALVVTLSGRGDKDLATIAAHRRTGSVDG